MYKAFSYPINPPILFDLTGKMFWIMLKIMGFWILISTLEKRKGEREEGKFIEVTFFVYVLCILGLCELMLLVFCLDPKMKCYCFISLNFLSWLAQ